MRDDDRLNQTPLLYFQGSSRCGGTPLLVDRQWVITLSNKITPTFLNLMKTYTLEKIKLRLVKEVERYAQLALCRKQAETSMVGS